MGRVRLDPSVQFVLLPLDVFNPNRKDPPLRRIPNHLSIALILIFMNGINVRCYSSELRNTFVKLLSGFMI